MRSIFAGFIVAVFVLLCGVACSSCTKVEPGYVGIRVNQYGDQKGVEDFPLVTGAVWHNPVTQDVYKFPTFRQNVIWDKQDGDESMTFNSIEGSVINADMAISYAIRADHVPLIFVTFRKGIDEITHIYLRSEARDSLARHAGEMRVIEIFGSSKQELLETVKNELNFRLGPLGFEIDMVSFVGALRCDDNVMRSINATIEATQLAISAQNKVVQSTAEANQAIESARGRAESVKIEALAQALSITTVANAQAEANLAVAKSLTAELIQYKSIEKWKGELPLTVVTGSEGGIVPMLQLGKQ